MAGKGSTYRKVKWQEFGSNYDKIFGRQNYSGTKNQEESTREPQRFEYREGLGTFEWKATDFQKGCVRYAEYIVQYHPPTADF